MSIAGVTTYAELKAGQPRGPSGTNPDEAKGRKALARVTAFVPTEAISTYVAVLALLTPKSGWGRWTLLGVIAIITVVICWYFWKRSTTALPTKALVWSIVFALIGLAAWASALPDSPFFSIHGYTTVIGGAAIILLASVIPKVAEIVGVSPPPEGS
jgi:hypothetical protein